MGQQALASEGGCQSTRSSWCLGGDSSHPVFLAILRTMQRIYAELSGGLFSTNAQVWKQFVIGRFMANKHIV